MSEIPRHWRMQTICKERYNLTGEKHPDGSVSLFHGPARPKFFPNVSSETTELKVVPVNSENLVTENTGGSVLVVGSGVIFQK